MLTVTRQSFHNFYMLQYVDVVVMVIMGPPKNSYFAQFL